MNGLKDEVKKEVRMLKPVELANIMTWPKEWRTEICPGGP